MPVSVDTRQALDLKNLSVPPSLHVLSVEAEDYTDWDGEPALRVTVVLDDSTDEEKISGAVVGAFKSAIRESLRAHGISLFAYIFLTKPSEIADISED